MERKLLAAAIDNRDAFVKLEKYLTEDDLTDAGRLVMGHIHDYYDRDPAAERVDMETLTPLVLQSVANPKHKETFKHIMDGLGQQEISGLNVAAEILGAKKEALGARLAVALSSGADEAPTLAEEYLDLDATANLEEEEESSVLNALSIDDLVGTTETGDLIQVYPRSLNERLDGGVMRGHHILVYARPEMGKTMLLINMTFGFLAQGLTVLYCGNEEPIQDTTMRILGRLSVLTRYEILRNRDDVFATAIERGYRNLYLKQLTPGTPREIEALVRDIKPDVLIIDQLRNLNMREDNRVVQLEKAANAVRQIGGRYKCVVISATQAGDSATGKAVLEQNDVDSSKTGIPGAVDIMIGLGATREDEASGRRVLSLPKNKRGGNHEFFPVAVDTTTSRVTSHD